MFKQLPSVGNLAYTVIILFVSPVVYPSTHAYKLPNATEYLPAVIKALQVGSKLLVSVPKKLSAATKAGECPAITA